MDPYLRRRRATEPNLGMGRMLAMGSGHPQLGMPHRLPINDLHYSRSLEEESAALGVSPTSTTSDNVPFWQDPPLSPVEQQQRAGLVYSMGMHTEPSPPPLSPHDLVSVSPPMNRLPPDSTLLTPLPGYHPPSPQLRMSPNQSMVQSMAQTNMSSLSPSQHSHTSFDDYQDRR